jgi:hypothetical protein
MRDLYNQTSLIVIYTIRSIGRLLHYGPAPRALYYTILNYIILYYVALYYPPYSFTAPSGGTLVYMLCGIILYYIMCYYVVLYIILCGIIYSGSGKSDYIIPYYVYIIYYAMSTLYYTLYITLCLEYIIHYILHYYYPPHSFTAPVYILITTLLYYIIYYILITTLLYYIIYYILITTLLYYNRAS